MTIYRSLKNVDQRPRGIALGVFDGVHQGHLELIRRMQEASAKKGLASSVFTFSYEDGLDFGGRVIGREFLTTEEEKIAIFRELGVEDIFLIPLQEDFQHLSPFDFLDQVIAGDLSGRLLAVGADARYGWKSEGDVDYLLDFAARRDLEPLIMGDIDFQGEKISSTRIRQSLAEGRLDEATAMMTRPFRLEGTVIPGRRLGTTLGFPTANMLYPEHSALLRFGVYQTRVQVRGQDFPAVTSVGIAPSVHRDRRDTLIESYLYDFSGDLYGEEARVEFMAFTRDELDFPSLSELKARIDLDLIQVRALHGL